MSGAILQGVPATTLDTDLWIDLPERQSMRTINLSLRLGAQMIRKTVVALSDGSLVNFLFRVDGLVSFATEWRRAVDVPWQGGTVKVLALERIIAARNSSGGRRISLTFPCSKASSPLARLRASAASAFSFCQERRGL